MARVGWGETGGAAWVLPPPPDARALLCPQLSGSEPEPTGTRPLWLSGQRPSGQRPHCGSLGL